MGKSIRLTSPFQPLIPPQAVEYFEQLLRPEFDVFELGSGASTLWLAERVQNVISVEHKPAWFEAISFHLQELKYWNVDLKLFSRGEFGKKFDQWYTKFILGFSRNAFDVVYIDGLDRTRVETMINAKTRIRPNGWLVVDDSNWPKLKIGLDRFREWPYSTYCGWKEGAIDGKPRYSCCSFFHKPVQSKLRVGIVSNWTKPSQFDTALKWFHLLRDQCNPFLLVRGDPLRVPLGERWQVPQITWVDFERGTKLFSCPLAWAEEESLDWVLFTEPREECWLDELRKAGFQVGFDPEKIIKGEIR